MCWDGLWKGIWVKSLQQGLFLTGSNHSARQIVLMTFKRFVF